MSLPAARIVQYDVARASPDMAALMAKAATLRRERIHLAQEHTHLAKINQYAREEARRIKREFHNDVARLLKEREEADARLKEPPVYRRGGVVARSWRTP